jgi:hypothetical protein
MTADHLAELVAFFKALADPSRLRILGVLAQREATVSELAELLQLKEPTVSHHLVRLRNTGLVTMREDGRRRIHTLDAATLAERRQALLRPEVLATASSVDPYAWERKVLTTFFEGDRLVSIPASRKKRVVVLRQLAERFDGSKRYEEREVNEILRVHHEDVATLRRELVGYGLLRRREGRYWRPA